MPSPTTPRSTGTPIQVTPLDAAVDALLQHHEAVVAAAVQEQERLIAAANAAADGVNTATVAHSVVVAELGERHRVALDGAQRLHAALGGSSLLSPAPQPAPAPADPNPVPPAPQPADQKGYTPNQMMVGSMLVGLLLALIVYGLVGLVGSHHTPVRDLITTVAACTIPLFYLSWRSTKNVGRSR